MPLFLIDCHFVVVFIITYSKLTGTNLFPEETERTANYKTFYQCDSSVL